MTNPDVNLQINGASRAVSNTQSTDKKDSKKDVRVPVFLFPGIKEEEIGDNVRLLNEFQKADSDYNKELSVDEYKSYLENSNSVFAPYMLNFENKVEEVISENPSLSRKDAVDFVVQQYSNAQMRRMDNFLSLLKYNPNTVDLQKAKALDENEIKIVFDTLKNLPQVHSGMTREEAVKIGGKILADFEAVSAGKDVIEQEDIMRFIIEKLQQQGITTDRIVKTILTASKENKLQMLSSVMGMVTDDSLVMEGFKEVNDLQSLRDALGISATDVENLNYEEIGKLLGSEFIKKLRSDMTMQDENNLLASQIKRIKSGQYTEAEKKLGYVDGQVIDDDNAILKLAMTSVVQSYLSTVSFVTKKICENASNEDKQAIVTGIFEALKETPQFRQILQTFGIESIDNDEIKQSVIAAVIENETGSTDMGTIAGAALGSTILANGNETNVKAFIETNQSQIDYIKVISNVVVENMPDGAAKDNIRQVIETAIANVESGNVSSGERTGDRRDDVNFSAAQPAYQTNPMSPDAYNVAAIREASIVYQQPLSEQMTPEQIAKQELQRFMEEMHQKGAVMRAKFDNMPLSKALSLIFDNIEKVPEQFRGKFMEKLTQMIKMKASSYPDVMCDVFIQGSDKLRTFLRKEHIITENDIYSYFDKKPEALTLAPDRIRIAYYKYKSEEEMRLV